MSYYMKKQAIISVSVSVKHQNFYIFTTEKCSFYNILSYSLGFEHDCIIHKRRIPIYLHRPLSKLFFYSLLKQ